ncbi:hypothetical protein BKA67DRAFT_529762 [Truncatella angustata]|uniref:Uncharacterized protein n=1 Tax=Truncatella angustata TaxID=152316 RepID=A0A9P8UUW5_9PEZI|nr:uncharacterized protein BKA67DRAFT_529762 [Truncatella angustata]KAH6659619.1 hypothetical protein BKA67DRAFT_529762 [Truncatella angustata]
MSKMERFGRAEELSVCCRNYVRSEAEPIVFHVHGLALFTPWILQGSFIKVIRYACSNRTLFETLLWDAIDQLTIKDPTFADHIRGFEDQRTNDREFAIEAQADQANTQVQVPFPWECAVPTGWSRLRICKNGPILQREEVVLFMPDLAFHKRCMLV